MTKIGIRNQKIELFCLITLNFSLFLSKPYYSHFLKSSLQHKNIHFYQAMKHSFAVWIVLFFQISVAIWPVHSLGNQCGIKYCTSCDPKINFCYECDLPYKPGFANQTICTRCANNCAVCQTVGQNSKGRCLSCLQNFNYSLDDRCEIFQIWIYFVTIASYVIFALVLFVVFCFIKRRKETRQAMWFEDLKKRYNKVDREIMPLTDFERMCDSLVELLKQCSSYNSLKFKDREYEKAIKIKEITIKNVPKDTHIKKIKIVGSDNSEFIAKGFIYVQSNQNGPLKMWLAKNYKRKVFSQEISKIIIYESDIIDQNKIKGRWYYHGVEDISGTWVGMRHQVYLQNIDNVNPPERVVFS